LSDVYLQHHHIHALVLDFDGVLNSHGENTVDARVALWLKAMHLSMPGLPLFILSNRPNSTRQQYFATHFPYINFVTNIRKKPYPDGLAAVLATLQEQHARNPAAAGTPAPSKDQILIVDDRLATGILAALIFGCKALFITEPLIKYRKHCIQEVFFKILRILEKTVINFIK
jgi:predicted HAD superfamily phosphohydrolase YqeG